MLGSVTWAAITRLLLSLLAITVVLGGCVYIPPIGQKDAGISPGDFEIGKTTRSSALAILKDPEINKGRFIFDQLHTTKGGLLIVIPAGYTGGVGYLPVGTKRTRLLLEFDDADILSRMDVERIDREPLPYTLATDTPRAKPPRAVGGLLPFKKGRLFRDARLFTAAAFSPDGSTIAASDGSDEIFLIDFTAQRMEQIEPEDYDPDGYVPDVAFSPDGKTLAVLSRTIRLIHLDSRRQTLVYDGHGNKSFWETKGASAMAFGPHGRIMVSGGTEGMVRVWETATGRDLNSWKADKDGIRAIAVSPDGSTIATTGSDGFIRLWDHQTGTEIGSVRRSGWPAFSRDGALLAISSASHLELWRLSENGSAGGGQLIDMTALPFVRSPYPLAPNETVFDPESRRLLHSSGATAIWDWSAGPRVAVSIPKGEVFLAFSPDGETMATASIKGVRLWSLPLLDD